MVAVKASADATWQAGGTYTGQATFVKPAAVAAGDFLIVQLIHNGTGSDTPPSGWTQVASGTTSTNVFHHSVYYRLAGGSEPANYLFDTPNSATAGRLTVLSGVDPSGSVLGTSQNVGLNPTTAPTALHVTVAVPPVVVALFANRYNATFTPPPGMTKLYDLLLSTSPFATQMTGNMVALSTSGNMGDFLASLSTAQDWASALIAVKPLNTPPNAPTLGNVGTIDRAVTNRFPWTFSDPDPGDSQSKFDLRYRLLGAGTWTDVTGTTPNQFWDAPPGTFPAGDHEWQARTYDSQGLAGPYSASSFFTAATAPSSPTITAPINGATVGTIETVTWSTPTQARYQVRRVADNAGTADPSTVYFDTGEVVNAVDRSVPGGVAFPTNNRWEHVQVRVRSGGLWSPWADARVQVSWTPPAAPVVTLTTYTASIGVAITNPAPGAGEPTVSYNDVYLSAAGVPEFRAATMVAPNGSWEFATPQSGLDYTFKVTSVASNGTTAETTAA